MKKNTKKAAAIVVETKINVAAPIRKPSTASILTRDLTNRHITCPACNGRNGIERLNQKCDFCGFMLLVRLFPDHSRYIRGLDVTPSGRDTYDIGDATADVLRGLDAATSITTAAGLLAGMTIEVGLSKKIGKQFKAAGFAWTAEGIEAWMTARWEGRNPGMVRMNAGNILRHADKRAAGDLDA